MPGQIVGLTYKDLSPYVLWTVGTVYAAWTFLRGERVKRDEVRRVEAHRAEDLARAAALDARKDEREDIRDEAARADRWKADALLWEAKARELMASKEKDAQEKDAQERDAKERDAKEEEATEKGGIWATDVTVRDADTKGQTQ